MEEFLVITDGIKNLTGNDLFQIEMVIQKYNYGRIISEQWQ